MKHPLGPVFRNIIMFWMQDNFEQLDDDKKIVSKIFDDLDVNTDGLFNKDDFINITKSVTYVLNLQSRMCNYLIY